MIIWELPLFHTNREFITMSPIMVGPVIQTIILCSRSYQRLKQVKASCGLRSLCAKNVDRFNLWKLLLQLVLSAPLKSFFFYFFLVNFFISWQRFYHTPGTLIFDEGMHKSIVNDSHLFKMYVFFVSLFPFRLIKFFTACCKHKFSHTEDLLGFLSN